MSLSVCAITGEPLTHPVASTKTGHLYEKEVIEKHLNSFPYCPITNQPMDHSHLVSIAPHEDSITRHDQTPNTYLNKLQLEYNLLAVDAFRLRKSLKETQNELTHSLYQNEAASQVIAKLLQEKQDAQNEIEKLRLRLTETKNNRG